MLTNRSFAPRSRSLLLTLVAATVGSILLNAASACAQGAFSDTFNTAGADSNFTSIQGTWTSNGGTYSVTSNIQTFNFSELTATGVTNYSNFALSYDVTTAYDGGLLFHSNAGVTGLVLIVRPDDSDAYFGYFVNGSYGATLSNETTLNVTRGSGLHVALTGQGNNYTAVISTMANPTVPIDTITLNGNSGAAAYTSGLTGFYSYNGGSGFDHFDNFSIVPEPSTWALLFVGATGLAVVAARRRRAGA